MYDLDTESQLVQQKPTMLRLKKRVQFLHVAAKGQKYPTPGIVLQLLFRDDQDVGRVGFTVTKKVGNSVVRNRIKRRLRALMHDVAQDISFDGIDLVLIGRVKTFSRSYQDLIKDLYQALHKAGIVSNNK